LAWVGGGGWAREEAPGSIDWERVSAALPYQRGPEHQAARRWGEAGSPPRRLWAELDLSNTGLLSLAKATRGVRDVLGLDRLFDCRQGAARAVGSFMT
jgi:hypothetical protein